MASLSIRTSYSQYHNLQGIHKYFTGPEISWDLTDVHVSKWNGLPQVCGVKKEVTFSNKVMLEKD